MTIVIDFDGTIVEMAYPEIGELRLNAKEVINRLYREGHDIVINTCRSGKYETAAIVFLIKNQIPFHCVNRNLEKIIAEYEQDTRKLSGDVYIDDKNLGGIPDDWEEIYKLLQQHPDYGKQ